jgi:type III secretion protein Q
MNVMATLSFESIAPDDPAWGAKQPVRLRPVAHVHAQFGNLINRQPKVHLPQIEEGTWLSVEPAGAPHGGVPGHGLMLQGSHGDLVLQSGLPFVRALTGIALEAETDPARAQWLMQSALALLPGPLGRLFSQMTKITQITKVPETVNLSAKLVLRTKDHVLTTHAVASWSVWCLLFVQGDSRPLTLDSMAPWWGVCSQAAVLAGTHHLSTQGFTQLVCGDTIVLDNPLFNTEGVGHIVLGPWTLAVTSNGGKKMEVTDIQLKHNLEEFDESGDLNDMNHENEHEGEDDDLDAFGDDHDGEDDEDDEGDEDFDGELDYDDEHADAVISQAAGESEVANLALVPVQLRFEMGTVSLSLKQLNALSVGTVIRLQGAVNPPHVTIRAGRQIVGRGELVDLEGRLGVQITQWAGQ